MKKKIIKIPSVIKTYYLIFSLFFVFTNILAQPYIYYPKPIGNSMLNDIYRINLAIGEDKLFIKNVGHVSMSFQNLDETKIYLDQRGWLTLIKVDNPSKKIKIAEGYESIIDVQEAPIINRVIIEYSDEEGFYKNTVIYNLDTYEPIDTVVIDTSSYLNINSFLSKNKKILYANIPIPDKTGVYFSAFDILNNAFLYKHKKVTNLGERHFYDYEIKDARQGKALFLYNNGTGYEGLKFFVVNPDSGLYFAPVSIPPVYSKGYLSANADFVIIEQVKEGQPPYYEDFHTGKMNIYSALTGDEITSLALPSSKSARILIFNKYPDMFYYYDFIKDTTIPVDLTKLQNENKNN